MSAASQPTRPRIVGRYALFDEIACGGMASVYLGRSMSGAGFSRTVAIKRMHPQLARDPSFAAMFLDEARLATRIEHPNVVVASDVAETDGELLIVMDFVLGEALSKLWLKQLEAGARVEPAIAVAVMTDALYGLHAAHEARDERGELLRIVHRDISPPNIIVGSDGVSRVLDFGVAKARGRSQNTVDGSIKGKLGYMAPEQLLGKPVDRRTDIYAAAVVLWELLVGKYLFIDEEARALLKRVTTVPEAPSKLVPSLPSGLDAILTRGLASEPEDRFESAQAMAMALESVVTPAGRGHVSEWVRRIADKRLKALGRRISAIEQVSLQALQKQPLQEHGPQQGELHSASPTQQADPERDDSVTNLMPLRPAPPIAAAQQPPAGTPQPAAASSAPPPAPAAASSPAPTRMTDAPSQPAAASPQRRGSRALLMVLGFGAAMLLGGAAVALLQRPTASPPPIATAPATAMVPPTAPAPPTPTASAAASATTTASAGAAPVPAPPATLRPSPRAAPRPAAPAGRDDCRPPYTLENGIKRYKRHCL